MCSIGFFVFFFKQKTAYEMRISDWSSDVCSSDLRAEKDGKHPNQFGALPVYGRRVEAYDPGVTVRSDGMGQRPGIFWKLMRLQHLDIFDQIGSASCRERVCQYV